MNKCSCCKKRISNVLIGITITFKDGEIYQDNIYESEYSEDEILKLHGGWKKIKSIETNKFCPICLELL